MWFGNRACWFGSYCVMKQMLRVNLCRLRLDTTEIGELECDAKTGPQQGICPMAGCVKPAEGCTMKTEFTKMGDSGCCPKPCNFVDAKGKKCQPKICPKKMINPNSCKCGFETTTVDGCPTIKCKTDCGGMLWSMRWSLLERNIVP